MTEPYLVISITEQQRLAKVYKLTNNHCTIGRGLDNDIVILDKNCPLHIGTVVNNAGQITLTTSHDNSVHQLKSGANIKIDKLKKVTVTAYLSNHSFSEQPQTKFDYYSNLLSKPILTASLVFTYLLFNLLEKINDSYSELKTRLVIEDLLSMLLMILIIPAVLSLISKFNKQEPKLLMFVNSFMLVVIVQTIIDFIIGILFFNSYVSLLFDIASVLSYLLIGYFAIWFWLQKITYLLKVQLIVSSMLLASTIFYFTTVKHWMVKDNFSKYPPILATFYPNYLSFNKGVSQAEFLADSEHLFAKANKLRQQHLKKDN